MSSQIKRRTFLKAIPAGLGMLALTCQTEKREAPEIQTTGDALYDNFRYPKATAKPFYRWW